MGKKCYWMSTLYIPSLWLEHFTKVTFYFAFYTFYLPNLIVNCRALSRLFHRIILGLFIVSFRFLKTILHNKNDFIQAEKIRVVGKPDVQLCL